MISPAPKHVRCAIYTRKSTEEGLQQDFNSLDAQRDSAEAYIASQKSEGWTCMADHYDDGGFTGGNMDRPAFKRLLVDVEAGKVDCVVVYKVDRLSRSLLDFGRIMETFDGHNVSFVSVTQQFNTTTSMGRLTLNILLSFAQFEREIISERTRDKIAAARRRGKWSGGAPVLGYDIQRGPGGSKLVVNAKEAKRVQEIFKLYLEIESLITTVRELDRRGWANKVWQTSVGRQRGGRAFDKPALFKLLTNVTYLGKVTYKGQPFEGEHKAILDEDTFGRVQGTLRRGRRIGQKHPGNKHGALLKGLVRCKACGCDMGHYFTSKKDGRRYRYYVCYNAQKRGWASCPAPSLPAGELEQFVVNQIKAIGRDDGVVKDAIRRARQQVHADVDALESQQATLGKQGRELTRQVGRVAARTQRDPAAAGELADIQARLKDVEQQATSLNEQIVAAKSRLPDDEELAGAIEAFGPVWDTLSPAEQTRLIHLLVQHVEYDSEREEVSVTFHPSGIRALATEEVLA